MAENLLERLKLTLINPIAHRSAVYDFVVYIFCVVFMLHYDYILY